MYKKCFNYCHLKHMAEGVMRTELQVLACVYRCLVCIEPSEYWESRMSKKVRSIHLFFKCKLNTVQMVAEVVEESVLLCRCYPHTFYINLLTTLHSLKMILV